MRACILVHTERGKSDDVMERLAEIPEVVVAFPVLGNADVFVRAEVAGPAELRELVDQVQGIDHIARTETLPEMEAP